MNRWTKSALVIVTIAFLASILPAQETKKDRDTLVRSAVKKATDQDKRAGSARQKRPDSRAARGAAARDIKRRPAAGYQPDAARGMMRQQQLRNLQAQIGRQKHEFQRYSSELNAIKKLALQEGATKTAAHIDQLLGKKKKEMDARIKISQDKLKDIQTQVQKQTKERAQRLQKIRQKRPVRSPDTDKNKDKKDK